MELLSCHLEANSIIGHGHVVVYLETTVKDPVEAINSLLHSLGRGTVHINEIQMRTRGQRHLLAFFKENGFADPKVLIHNHDSDAQFQLDKIIKNRTLPFKP